MSMLHSATLIKTILITLSLTAAACGPGPRRSAVPTEPDIPPADASRDYASDSRSMALLSPHPILAIIANYLAEEFAINTVEGGVQCAATLEGILDNYYRCVNDGGDPDGCARNAAKNIKDYACKSYCTCS